MLNVRWESGKMEILYTLNNMPLVQTDEGEIIPFIGQNIEVLVGELSTDINSCNELKSKIVEIVKETVDTKQITNLSTPIQISEYINSIMKLNEYHIINEIIDRSIKMYTMLNTPQPHEKWIWDQGREEWIPPIPYPQKLVDSEPDKYIWSDDMNAWVPSAPAPHRSWIWDAEAEEYISPIPYPLDAEPNEFIWDEEKMIWVVND